jgi:hypothetical protein
MVLVERVRIYSELDALKLTESVLLEAIAEGEVARDSCTPNDPPSCAGFLGWARTVRALRDRLVPAGWRKDDWLNLPVVISPDNLTAIAVMSGDSATGQADRNPRPKYDKGEVTFAAVMRNQCELFSDQRQTPTAPKMWILLRRRDRSEVRAELSLPDSISDAGAIETWRTRILLGPAVIGGGPELMPTEPDEIVVPIGRKVP